MRFFAFLLSVLVCIATNGSSLLAEEKEKTSPSRDLPLVNLFDTKSPKVEAQADTVEYLRDEKKLIAKNNVILSYHETQIMCDYAEVETETKKTYARGHVLIFRRGRPRAEGEEIYYDFENNSGQFPDGRTMNFPWFSRGEDVQQIREGVKVVKNGGITSCHLKKPHYELKAKKITLYDGDKVVARNVLIYILGKPVFWLPFVTLPLQENTLPFTLSGGHNDRFGYYVQAKKGFSIIEQVWGEWQIDWRSKRGFGAGAKFNYAFKKYGYGDIKLYLTQDDRAPTPGIDNPYSQLEDRQRGRVTWRHRTDFDQYSHLVLRYNRLADEYFLQDFFQKEFHSEIEQPSFITLMKNSQNYGSLIHVEKQMNPFESLVEKLPKVQLDWKTQPFLRPWLFYESQLSYVNLSKRLGRSEINADVNRADNFHEWSAPFKWRDFKFTPNVNIRNTYYSRELESDNDHFRVAPGWGADLRTQYYKTYPYRFEKWGFEVNQLRHVFEPSIQYQGSQSTVSDEKLEHFDSIDQIDDANIVTFGMENRIQTKRVIAGKVQRVDIVSLNTFLSYEFHPDGRTSKSFFAPFEVENTDSAFSVLSNEAVLRPYQWLQYRMRHDFNFRDDQFHIFTQDLTFKLHRARINFGHRYAQDISESPGSNQFVFDGRYTINKLWDVGGYIRWDPKDHGLEEWQVSAKRDLHDFDLNFGYNVRDSAINGNNKTFFVDLSLKVYPIAHLNAGNNSASFSGPRIGETVAGSYAD